MTIPGQAFTGPTTRLAPDDFARAAKRLGCEVAAIRAFAGVESAGAGFDKQGRIKVRPEGHWFWHELPPELRAEAARQGLAWPAYDRQRQPPPEGDARWRVVEAMIARHREAALRACSWGAFQVMGFNCRKVGHPTVEVMVAAALTGEGAQLGHFCTYIETCGLADELRGKAWLLLAYGYNGSGAAKEYAGLLTAAYTREARTAGPVKTGSSPAVPQNAASPDPGNRDTGAAVKAGSSCVELVEETPQPTADALMDAMNPHVPR